MENKFLKGGAFLIEDSAPNDVLIPEEFDDEIAMIRQTTRDFCQNEIVPNMERLEKQEPGLSQALLRKLGELGIFGIEVEEKYDGSSLSKLAATVVAEEMSRAAGFSVSVGAHMTIGMLPIVYFGNEQQKSHYLPKMVACDLIGAYALTEPESGSDAMGAKTQAVLSEDGKHWILNGTKMWISNGGFADVFIIFAKVDGERKNFSAFIVERAHGVKSGAEEKKMGIKSSSTTQLMLENVEVPVENLLGEIGDGAKIAFNILNVGRFKLGAGGVGSCKIILEICSKYAKEREQFKQPIASFGLIQEKLGEMAARTFALESATYRTIGYIDALIGDNEDQAHKLAAIEEYALECSLAKVLGTEVMDFCADEGVQLHGGYGYSQDYVIEQIYRDSRINRLFEGTNEINRLLVPGRLLKSAAKGNLPLFDAIGEAASGLGDNAKEEGAFAAERAGVKNFKRCALIVLGAAANAFGNALEREQEVLGRIADIIMETYAAESALLRAQKLNLSGKCDDAHIAAVRVYVSAAAENIAQWSRTALSRFLKDEALAQQLAFVQELTKLQPIDTIGLTRALAQTVLETEGYPFS